MEPRSAAVEHVAAPVEAVLAPVDKGSSPWRLQRPCLSPRGLPFLLAALPRYHILIMPGWQLRFQCQRDMKTEKPGWLKRRLVWPLKLHILRSLPFKVGAFLLIKAFITWARCFLCGLVLPPTGQMSDLMQMALADGFLCLAATGEVSSNIWTWIWVRDWDNNCNTLS